MNTSSYNHNSIGTDEKPLIENREFKWLISNFDVIIEQLQSKSFEKFQEKLLQDKLIIIYDLIYKQLCG